MMRNDDLFDAGCLLSKFLFDELQRSFMLLFQVIAAEPVTPVADEVEIIYAAFDSQPVIELDRRPQSGEDQAGVLNRYGVVVN